MEDSLSRTYAAIAHPTRRALLERIQGRLTRISDLVAAFDVSFNTISKHVRILEAAGLVKRHVHGRNHFLTVRASPLVEAAAWIDDYCAFWKRRMDDIQALTRRDFPQ